MKQFLLFLFLFSFLSPASSVTGKTGDDLITQSTVIDSEDEFIVLTNPVKNGVLKLKVHKTDTKNLSITIISSLGEQVYNAKTTVNKEIINFDVSKLAAGMYFLRIQSDESSIVKKLIIQ